MTTIRETAHAKINLDLLVCRRREDGYHDLDSLVAFADIGDLLSFSPADELTLSIQGPFANALASEPDNLVIKAARSIASSLGRSPSVHIVLDKHLPVASGMGGGSADAAATLRGLVRFWDLPMIAADLGSLAGELGADVPACLGSHPVRMTGIGNRLAPLALPEPLSILLVNPGIPVATPAIFKALDHMSGERAGTFRAESAERFLDALRKSANDLEAPARQVAPIVGEVLEAIADQPACQLARMSGSGATCFGLFQDRRALERARECLRDNHPHWWIAQTVCRPTPV